MLLRFNQPTKPAGRIDTFCICLNGPLNDKSQS